MDKSYVLLKTLNRSTWILLTFITLACATQRPIAKSDSYSISQFEKLSRYYSQTVLTESGDHIHVNRLSFQPDSIYIVGDIASHRYSKRLALSEIKNIRLAPKSHPGVNGLLIGLGISVPATVLAAKSDSYFAYISLFIPPVCGLIGFLIGTTFNHTKVFRGDYRIISDSSTYRFQPVKARRLPRRHVNPILDTN